MPFRPSATSSFPKPITLTNTRNLFEVAAITSQGLRFDDARREYGKVTFTFRDPRASEILAKHRRGDLTVSTRTFVNEINAARDIALGMCESETSREGWNR